MKEKIEKLKNLRLIQLLKQGLASKYFPFVTAAVTLLCYYLGLDIVLIYYISITGILIILLLDDITPFISSMLFLSIMISYKNSPSGIMGGSDYYFRTANLIQIFLLLSLYILAVLYRIVLTGVRRKFRLTPEFFGLCVFSATLFLNGLASENYETKNLLYGLIMAASFLCVFCMLKDNIKLDSVGYEKIAFAFLAFSAVLVIEVFVKYLASDSLFIDGVFIRSNLTFGWGIWNTMGMWLTMCIPPVIYLACKKKYGFIFTVYSLVICVAVCLTNSRQSILVAAFIFLICVVVLLVKRKNRIPDICILTVAATVSVILIIIFREKFVGLIENIFGNLIVDGQPNGSGRWQLWQEAFNNYRSAPLLGTGFYVKFSYQANSGLGFMPYMCHNTVLQILSSCGTLGIIAYAIHRIQTVKCYLKNVTLERTFIALTILDLLLTSLVDNHIFNIFPTIVYSCLTAVIVNDTQKKKAVIS